MWKKVFCCCPISSSSFRYRRDSVDHLNSSARSEKSPSHFILLTKKNSFGSFVSSRKDSGSSLNLNGKKDHNSSVGGDHNSVEGDNKSVEGDNSPAHTIEGDEESITGDHHILTFSSIKGSKIVPIVNDINIV